MKNNYCVIMAGGVGARFWPYSRNERPKQFLDFLGTGKSLIQLTYDRFRKVVPAENILIVSNVLYKDLILEQLPDLLEDQILLEPSRRNTAPCIDYAIHRIKAKTNKANIIVAPSDHLILKEDEFLRIINQGIKFIETNDCLLTLGITPSRPETGYGYIQVEEGVGNLRKVKTFTEKPNRELAQVFVDSGEFFWNSGIFLWNLQTIKNAFHALLPEVDSKFEAGKNIYGTPQEANFIEEIYASCPNISIDYGLMEKASNVYVICAEFGWTDLGTWGSLYEISQKDENQNAMLACDANFYDSTNNLVVLEKGKLAVIQGLDDSIVVESDNVLLICKKTEEQR
ncbi:MAG: mannose-1-phosphate guanylyltransferase, partial [Prevotellaceae bacterium]|nr:mannose-1-phosphate guanylyltransferase [Prevotellaceae bacterium]